MGTARRLAGRCRRGAGFAAAVVVLVACGTTQSVRPLGAGRRAVDFSVGGPLVAAGAVAAPVPAMLVGYRQGLDDRSDFFGRFHLLPPLFGVVAVEGGASRMFVGQHGAFPALSASAQALVVAGRTGAFAIPAASAHASWASGRWVYYAGSQEAVSFGRRLNGSGAAFHWAPYGGATWTRGCWAFGGELRWWEPLTDRDVLVYWRGAARHGALAPMFSVTRIGEFP